ncbi:MAG: hypothetical protein J6E40_08510 [Lachnospiraceae bacterium]|jgi:flagellar biosynthesis/type III secretory pathway M-ring protein FliF/YscJ|nr:hypothetical protein [Lachnospiraceae bacterium]
MIDREGAGAGFFRKSRTSEPAEEYPQQSGLSNKAMVYLVIMALIVILCIVYVFQLRSARRGGNSADTAAVTADTAPAEASGEPEAETPAEGAAEAPAEGAAEAPAEGAEQAPEEGAEQTPAE